MWPGLEYAALASSSNTPLSAVPWHGGAYGGLADWVGRCRVEGLVGSPQYQLFIGPGRLTGWTDGSLTQLGKLAGC